MTLYVVSSCDTGSSEIVLDEVLSLSSGSDSSLAQTEIKSTIAISSSDTSLLIDTLKTTSHSSGYLQSSSASFAYIQQSEQPSMSTSEVVTALQPCNALCCQDSLEVYQVTDKSILKKTRKVQGHSRQFCPKISMACFVHNIFCSACRYCYKQNLLTDKLGEATFVTEGFDNWKKAIERFERHARSGLHKKAILNIQYLKKPGIDVHSTWQP